MVGTQTRQDLTNLFPCRILAAMAGERIFIYRIGSDDLISYVNADWLEFAVDNGAESLVRPGVLGKPLWQFCADADTAHLYQVILTKIRKERAVVCFPFRCDGPQLRRYMEMIVQPWGPGGVEFHTRILREEPRAPVPLLEPDAARSEAMLRMCSWCKRIATPEWLEVEDALQHLRLFDRQRVPQITHCICEDCRQRVRSAVG